MVTPGAAPLIVSAFRRVRRSTSTNAFQTCDAGRARVHRPSEAVNPRPAATRASKEVATTSPYLSKHRVARASRPYLMKQKKTGGTPVPLFQPATTKSVVRPMFNATHRASPADVLT